MQRFLLAVSVLTSAKAIAAGAPAPLHAVRGTYRLVRAAPGIYWQASVAVLVWACLLVSCVVVSLTWASARAFGAWHCEEHIFDLLTWCCRFGRERVDE